MAILMTGLCEKGVDLIWKQCDEEQFAQGLEYLEEAVRAGDPEALFFIGYCYSWADGGVGFNDKKAYECYKEGIRAGSYRCAIGAVRAGQYDEELQAISQYTLEESYKKVREAAEKGDAFAAYQIGSAFEWENLFEFLPEEERQQNNCLKWYEKAAEGGIVPAMVKSGKCYLNGERTEKDIERGLYYADQAASRGDAWGLCRMGLYYQEHDNPEAAFEYFQAASCQGDKTAASCLGQMYLTGTGTERDIKKAVEALETAVSRGDTKCLATLGDIFYRDEVVERDDERAFYWYNSAYAIGESRVALPLGHLYRSAGENQDYKKSEKFLREAEQTETDGSASLILGNMYRDGTLGTPDVEQAIKFYTAGCEKNNPECMEILGNMYFHGEGVEIDYQKSFDWLNKALQAGTLQSYSTLAFLYMRGQGCEADEEKAIELFEKATEMECDGDTSYELGYLYERRNSSPDDLDRAAECYQDAIEMGNESAGRRFAHFKKNLFGKWKVNY
ncbi:MAG: SEL1-like repeat protein [Clostridium sp.]